MDIKLKNIKYSFIAKAAAVFLIWLSFAGLFAAVLFWNSYSEEIQDKNYYDSEKFLNEFLNKICMAIISTEVKELAGEASGSTAGNTSAATAAGFNKIIQSSMPAYNFNYIIINTKTGNVVTNLNLEGKNVRKAVEELSKKEIYFFYSIEDRKYSYNNLQYVYPDTPNFLNNLRSELKYAPVEIYATINSKLKAGDVFYNLKVEYDKIHGWIPAALTVMIILFIIGLFCFIFLITTAGRHTRGGEVKPALIDWFYTDLLTFVVFLAALLSLSIARNIGYDFNYDIPGTVSAFILLSADLLIGLGYILSMVRHIRRGTLLRHTLIFKLFKLASRNIVYCFTTKAFKPVIIILLLVYGGLNAILFALASHTDSGGFWFLMLIMLLFNIVSVYYASKGLASLTGIMRWVKEMSDGNLDYSPVTENMSIALISFVRDIGNMQNGLKQAVAEAVKGERLKTELISNVSHDLKTPLTSIINYVDLLKKEKLGNETINGYIGVLEDKSARLKKLVDDLIEASKATSGDMAVNFGRVDLCSLTEQAVAEYSDKALAAGLDVRVKLCEKPALVRGDGTLMWRVMDNLLSNAVKYSQKNSRVYVEVEEKGILGTITIKNISEAPLDIPAEQLMERFVRGDSSRTTDGSGLGLSIARSLAQLQGGRLDVKVDGDLFKVIVEIPLDETA